MPAQVRNSKDIAAQGSEIYERLFRKEFEPKWSGRYAAIDISSERAFVADFEITRDQLAHDRTVARQMNELFEPGRWTGRGVVVPRPIPRNDDTHDAAPSSIAAPSTEGRPRRRR